MDLTLLNSVTKYPSIPTYHALGEKGRLTERRNVEFIGPVVVTEKIDGTNVRIVVVADGDWFIGSREELLTAKGDRVPNPSQGIVTAVGDLPDRLPLPTSGLRVFYFEVYGGKIGKAAREYASDGRTSLRLFDVVECDDDTIARAATLTPEVLARWRETEGQRFCDEIALGRLAGETGLELTPRIAAEPPPAALREASAYLSTTIPASLAVLNPDSTGRPEGVVVRTPDRSAIAKLRFEDYRRTLR